MTSRDWTDLPIPDWLERLLRYELVRLQLTTKYAPQDADEFEAVVRIWIETVYERLQHAAPTEAEDAPRLRAGFRHLHGACTDFPAPAELLRALPARKEKPRPRALPAPEQLPPETARHRLAVVQRAARRIGRIDGRAVTVRDYLYEKPE